MADLGRWTRATRGQKPPRMTAFTRLVLSLFRLREGSVGELEGEMESRDARAEKRSLRRDVISRMVEGEMKF